MNCKVLIVDNFDSFTYNIVQYMGEVCGEEPDVMVNTTPIESIDLDRYDCFIISLGIRALLPMSASATRSSDGPGGRCLECASGINAWLTCMAWM